MKKVLLLLALAGGALPAVAQALYTADFAQTNGFAFGHYHQRTAHQIVTTASGAVLRVIGLGSKEKSKDTAWKVKTASFGVSPQAHFAVRLVLQGDVPGCGAIRPGAAIAWLDGADKPLVITDALGKDVPLTTALAMPTRSADKGKSCAISKGQVPAGAARARLKMNVDNPDLLQGEVLDVCEMAYFEKPATGDWPFSDTEAPELEVLTPSPCSDARTTLRVRFKDASPIQTDSVSFAINGTNTPLAAWAYADGAYTYTPTASWPMDSVIRIQATAADVHGYAGTSWGFVAITTNRVAHPKWTVRDDGVVLQDGVPFFPLGITSVHPCPWNNNDLDQGLALLKANGINCVHTYMVRNRPQNEQSAHYGELLAACAKHQVMLYAEPATRESGHHHRALTPAAFAARDAMLAANLVYSRAHSPAQVFWGIGDDTAYLQLPHNLKRNYQFCKAVDPDVLTISADVTIPPPQQALYVPYADVLILECYPMRAAEPQEAEMAILAQTLEDGWRATRLAECPSRSVMAMPQVFKGWSSWKRYPTAAEVRTEYFLALACKARGIIAYTSYSYKGNEGPFNNPQHQAEFLAVTREVAALIPRLVKRDAAQEPTVTITQGPQKDVRGGAAIRCLLKEDGLLIAVNPTAQEVTASIRLPTGLTLTHTFPPGGVLVRAN